MAHTPGPWVNNDGLVYGVESRERFAPYPSLDIFDAGEWPGELRDEAMANAALIAAAPDLLAALKAMVEPWHGFSDVELKRRHLMGAIDTPDLERITQARAAIKAAEGGA
jgi:hypothetical protein